MIGVVACSKRKGDVPAAAVELYQGRTFRAAVALLRAMGARRVVILSALHGPVDEGDTLAPYERSLIGARRADVREWEASARVKLRAMVPEGEEVVAVVPADYAGALVGLGAVRLFAGLPQGKLYRELSKALRERVEVSS